MNYVALCLQANEIVRRRKPKYRRVTRVSSPSGTVGSQGEGTGGTSTPGACRPEGGES